MRLLQCENNGDFSLTKFAEDEIPKYAILSHRWGAEEVTYHDLLDGTGKSKAGYGKIQFCGEQARRDGLQYIWVDTCCIDKSNAVEYQHAINSMFRYEWFRRGWTLQELIAPALVDFFCKDRELLGNKVSLERHICEVTGILAKALRGSRPSDFTVAERMSWTECRETTYKEDKAYLLLGIFDVYMPLIYGEGKDRALARLREEIDKASRGSNHEDFSVTFSLSDVFDIEHFVAREDELSRIHKTLRGDGSRRAVVLQGLRGIGKT
ncbi:hypothetical protein ACEPPN_006632 [Leptodophora sp. 'Broadleaf-Isolate-01']